MDPTVSGSEATGASDTSTIKKVEERIGTAIPNTAGIRIASSARSSVAMTAPDETYSATIEGNEQAVSEFVSQVAPPATQRVTVESRCSASTSAPAEPRVDAVEQGRARNIVANLDKVNKVERCAPVDVLFLPRAPRQSYAAIYHQGPRAIIALSI
ncbi:hypothetical protein FK529_06605 [Tsukamurella asaccharolytica]|uniref:Uncharacterized protein n=1 Tax=Tsukamurella asaccharolytica TaxID=2592067 RepID=A0A5C5RAH2_9ACTN|nr:hypothetical protein [Tsukamurella asaccharolytica]TWS19818.1 hypothetical protein FK529_06605 [Tsukamurella asaccharolytica]